jgi:hypothetical protein
MGDSTSHLCQPSGLALRTLYYSLSVKNTRALAASVLLTASPSGGLLCGRPAREHIQTAGPRLREGLQRYAFGSGRVGPQLVESTADES